MPSGILKDYQNFQETMKVRNTVAGGLGSEYVRKRRSYPRGDPFSMMLVALQLRACMLQMIVVAVAPRILADDLQIFSTGTRHFKILVYAFDLTHKHMEDLGRRLHQQSR